MSKPMQGWSIDYTDNMGKVCSSTHVLPNYKPWNCSIYDCITYLMDLTVDDRDSNKPLNCRVYYYKNQKYHKGGWGMVHTGHIEVSVLKDVVTITMKNNKDGNLYEE